ncbi:hypothetical protein, partial [Agrobacterium tumefaciens]|uniref:hypothetical protein n=2 Tax=Pseudomonadati TaxID=3379134 RepID=UPI001CBC1FAA
VDDQKSSRLSKKTQTVNISEVHPQEVEVRSDPEKEAIMEKLKEKARRDWPNDYTTQEFWINEQIESYEYMKTVENNSIKRQAEKDWPLDFSTQKFWYEEQVKAKERLE